MKHFTPPPQAPDRTRRRSGVAADRTGGHDAGRNARDGAGAWYLRPGGLRSRW